MPGLRNARAVSAGGVIHRSLDGRIEVVVGHRRHPPLWALPKGTPEPAESLEQTAQREAREETGLEVALVAPLRPIRYVFVRGRVRFHKTVHFYLMRALGGDLALHDHEFDEVRWLEAEEAAAILSYPSERGVVEEARALIAARAGAPV